MGCFLSLLCGIGESERRSQLRQRDRINSTNGTEIIDSGEDVLVYCPENEIIGVTESTENKNNYGIPLKRIKFSWKLNHDMSIEDLEKRRKAFWETCHTLGGQAQVWDALKLICEESFEDLAVAGSILDSCGVILPYGQLTEIYDSRGYRYHLPPYCVCDPIIGGNGVKSKLGSSLSDYELQQVKVRLSDGTDIILDVKGSGKIEDIKAQIRDKQNIDLARRMVVLWCGRVLDDHVSLGTLNLPQGAVLQVMVP